MKSRRQVIVALGASAVSLPLRAVAQQASVRRVGVLLFNSPQTDPVSPLLEGLHALGYMEGVTLAIDFRFCEWRGRTASRTGSRTCTAEAGCHRSLRRRRGTSRQGSDGLDPNSRPGQQ